MKHTLTRNYDIIRLFTTAFLLIIGVSRCSYGTIDTEVFAQSPSKQRDSSSMHRNARTRQSPASALSVGLVAMTISQSHESMVTAWVSPTAAQAGFHSAGRGLVRPRDEISMPSSGTCRCREHRRLSSKSSSEDRVVVDVEEGCYADSCCRPNLRQSPASFGGHYGSLEELRSAGMGVLAGLFVMVGGGMEASLAELAADGVTSVAPTSSVTVQDLQRYNGFEDYAAKGQQMENSDVSCFANECKRETASCFTDGSCLKEDESSCRFKGAAFNRGKGLTCLGRCKGEQECATRCFAQYGSAKLDSWLTCTLEDHGCVKIPKDMDFSAIDKNPPHIVKGFDAKLLQGTWYKVLGVNKKYDCFDCQKNTFSVAQEADNAARAENEGTGQFADIKVDFRLAKPDSNDFWENTITERLEVDPNESPRTFHTDGKLFGLSFKENWYVTGHSMDPGAEFVFVQYRGHTLQGSYEGGFVYSRKPFLPPAAMPKIARVAREHGIDPDAMIPIDNTCSLRSSLPKAGDTKAMGILERLKYEAAFVYDLMEWVHPGTIHKYAKADARQKDLERATSQAAPGSTTVANTLGVSSSLKAGPSWASLDDDEG